MCCGEFRCSEIFLFFLHNVQSIRSDRLAGFDIRSLVSDNKNLVLKVVAFFNISEKVVHRETYR